MGGQRKLPGRSKRKPLRGLLAIATLLASVLAVVSTADAANVPFDCSVEATDGGVVLSWQEVPGAAEYQYKLDRPGAGSAYARVSGNSATIPLPDGATASIGLSPVFADGSTQPRTPCGEGGPNDGTGSVDLVCDVASADGAINVSWNEINGAVEYAWKLSVAGQSAKYRRVKGTNAFISLPDGVVGSVSVTPVFADGSIRSRSECGSAAPNDGTGDMPLSCTVSSASTGVLIEWTPVASATEYQYKLSVEGSGARYRRASGTSVLAELPAGSVATVGLAPILTDGSTMPRTPCGTATAGGDPDPDPEQPMIDSCTVADAGGDIARFSWAASDTDGLDSLTWKIIYTFADPSDPGGAAGEVARSFAPNARSYNIAFAPGTEVAGTISIEEVNGQLVSPVVEIDCGSVTLADPDPEPEEPVVVSCRAFSTDDGVGIEWPVENPQNVSTFSYEYSWVEPDTLVGQNEIGTNPPDRFVNDGTTWRVTIGLRLGSLLTRAQITTESVTGQRTSVMCENEDAISGGVPGGPPCDAFAPNVVAIFSPSYETDGFEIESTLADGSVVTLRTESAGRFTPPGPPGTTVFVRVRSVLPDGTLSLTTDCGEVEIPEAADQFSVSRCATVGLVSLIRVEWDANVPPDYPGFSFLISYTATLPDGSVASDEIREFSDDRRTFIRDLPPGTVVSAQLSVVPGDGGPAPIDPIDCGAKTVGGDGPSPACTVDGLVVTWTEDATFDRYAVAISQNGDLPTLAEIGIQGSPHTINRFGRDLIGTFDVFLHGDYVNEPGVAAGSFCGTVTFEQP